MRYGLFLGCNMPALRPDVERAIRLTMPPLGVELVEMEGYVCCPAFGTFPSMDEAAQLAVNGWNLSLGEAQGVDLMVECGSCYSSLRTGRALMTETEGRLKEVNELLAKGGKHYEGRTTVRHISDVLRSEVGVDRIREVVRTPLEGRKVVIQYPCHTLYPSDVVGFEGSPARPHALADLVEALGAEVCHYSLEYECCGGAGGFHRSSKKEASAFVRKKLDAIAAETEADLIVVSCITCLMFLDRVQVELNKEDGAEKYTLPVLDYNQLLALCMGYPAKEVAALSDVPRDRVLGWFE